VDFFLDQMGGPALIFLSEKKREGEKGGGGLKKDRQAAENREKRGGEEPSTMSLLCCDTAVQQEREDVTLTERMRDSEFERRKGKDYDVSWVGGYSGRGGGEAGSGLFQR